MIRQFYLTRTNLRYVGMVLLQYFCPPNLNLHQNLLSNTFRNIYKNLLVERLAFAFVTLCSLICDLSFHSKLNFY